MNENFEISRLGEGRIASPLEPSFFVPDDAAVLVDPTNAAWKNGPPANPATLEQAGPRRTLFFEAAGTRAAIVTCGGLCPGLNDVVRALTMVLWYRYGIRDILGLRYGYEGLAERIGHVPVILNPDVVADIHQHGGTILGTSRGDQDPKEMVDYLEKHRIRLLFTIGGDGTQRGALEICKEITRRHLPISVVGIPKTIDNDISYTDRTFGFETAVAMSQLPISAAHMEAKGVRNGIGLIKLMGRDSGFVAAYASLASSDVNLVLIPEVPFQMEKLMSFLEDRLHRKAHAVVVVAEGAGQDFVRATGKDASGNQKLGDIGLYLKKAIETYFDQKKMECHLKYIDPSYMIRSERAIADDSVFCFQLAEMAAHAAMSGRTAMVVAIWNGHFVHVPMTMAVATRKKINPTQLLWQSVLENTGQPSLA